MSNADSPPPVAPAASALMSTTDAIGLPVTTSAARAQAFADVDAFQRDPQRKALLLAGDPHAKAEYERAVRLTRTSTEVTVGGQEQTQHADLVVEGWNSYVGASLADVYGPELGAAIEAEQRSGGPIPEAEHRQARTAIAEMKGDREFQEKLRAGNVRAKARWSLAHRQVVRPIKMD